MIEIANNQAAALEQLSEFTNKSSKKCKTDLEVLQGLINDTTVKLHEQLDNDRDFLLAELKKFLLGSVDTDIIKKQAFQIEGLRQTSKKAGALAFGNDVVEIIDQSECLLEQGDELLSSITPTMAWAYVTQFIEQKSRNMVGSIQIERNTNTGAQPVFSTRQDVCIPIPDSSYIDGVCAGDGVALVAPRGSCKIKIIKNDTIVTSLSIPGHGHSSKWGCLALHGYEGNGDIKMCFADNSRRLLQQITISQDYIISNISDFTLNYNIRSLTFDATDQKFATTEYSSNTVRLYSISRMLLKTCIFTADSANTLCAVKHPDGRIVTVKEKSVEWLDEKDQRGLYSRPEEEQLGEAPVNMAVDNWGNILVLYNNHDIQLLTPDGKLIKQIVMKEDLREATCMSLSGGRLYVGTSPDGKSAEVKVYKYSRGLEAKTIDNDIKLTLTIAKC